MLATSSRAPFRFRPLGLAELLDEMFRIYRRDLGLFAGLSLAVTLPGVIMGLIAGSYKSVSWTTRFLQSIGNADQLQAMSQTPPPEQDPVLGLLASIVRLIMVPVAVGAIVYAANQVMTGRATTILGALEGTLQRYWHLALYTLLISLLLVAGIFVVTVPVVIWLLVRWGVGIPALLVEHRRPISAMGRSTSLVDGHWWRTLGMFCLVFLMTWVASALMGGMAGAIFALLPGLAEDLRAGLIVVAGSLAGALVAPLTSIAMLLIYYDLRVRRDGFDLDQLAQQAQPPSVA